MAPINDEPGDCGCTRARAARLHGLTPLHDARKKPLQYRAVLRPPAPARALFVRRHIHVISGWQLYEGRGTL